MAELIAPLPRTTLINGMSIVFEAIDASTGATVPGVTVSGVAIYADTDDNAAVVTSSPAADNSAEVPLWTPLPALNA